MTEFEPLGLNDRVLGMFVGHMLGDALGFQHEFGPKRNYTGKFSFVPIMQTQWQGRWYGILGQCSDDTEMMLSLCKTLIDKKGYDRSHAIKTYQDWANSGAKCMGKNTRAIFKNVKTIKGSENRIKKKREEPIEQWSQSNGALMRCIPLSIINNYTKRKQIVEEDCSLTNFHPYCIELEQAYISILNSIINNQPVDIHIFSERINEIWNDVLSDKPKDVKVNKGWCEHAFYFALKALNANRYDEIIGEIIKSGGDTDTNAAIAGAIIGAKLGYSGMCKEETTLLNIQTMFEADASDGDLSPFGIGDDCHPSIVTNDWIIKIVNILTNL